jgi:hypothetical protein
MMNKAITILLLGLVFFSRACQSNSDLDESSLPEPLSDSTEEIDPIIKDEQEEEHQLFYDSFTETKILESRQEMSEILEKIGAAEPNNEEFTLINVNQTQDGYTGYDRICDERFNGSLLFSIGSGSNGLQEFYGFYEPFLEIQGQDLFLYTIEEIFVQPNEEMISLTVRSVHFDNETGNYYTDMADPTEDIEIWKDLEFGTVARLGNDYYLDANGVKNINTSPCPEFEH